MSGDLDSQQENHDGCGGACRSPGSEPSRDLRNLPKHQGAELRFQRRERMQPESSQHRDGPIQCRERLGGLLKYYHRGAE